MRKLIFIPVREDSKRLPEKALLEVNGLPLWYHTYLQCAKSNVDEVWVVTDSQIVMNQCHQYNVEYDIIKNAWCGTVRVAKAYQMFTKKYEDDLILNVQCDYPQINPKSINLLFNTNQYIIETYDFITLYYNFNFSQKDRENKDIVKIIASEDIVGEVYCHYFTREPYPYSLGHIGLYLFQPYNNIINIITNPQTYLSKMENLEQLTWLSYGAKIKALFTERELSINTIEDFQQFKQEVETK